MGYSLMLNTSVVDGTPKPYIAITGIAKKWRRWTDWIGGYDVGEFEVYGDPGILLGYFESWLRLDVTEEVGGIVTWNGEIRKMDFIQGNMPKSLDFNECYNRVACTYGTGGNFTTWGWNHASKNKYGTREGQLYENCDTEANAGAERDFYLEKYGWPPLISGRNLRQQNKEPHLKVYVMGYKYSVNDSYSPSQISASDTITAALNTTVFWSPYVSARKLDTNSNAINDPNNDRSRGWDYMKRLLKMTDASGNLYRGWFNKDRKFTYKKWDLTPAYYVRRGMVFADAGTSMLLHPRWVQPGIYRDMDSLLTGKNRGGMLNDRNDFLVERVMVDDKGNLGFSSDDGYDYMTLLRSNTTGESGEDIYPEWQWDNMTDDQKDWWIKKEAGELVGPPPT